MKSSGVIVSNYKTIVGNAKPSFLLALVASCALAACGGGGSSTPSDPTSSGVPAGSGVPVTQAPVVQTPGTQTPVAQPVAQAPVVITPVAPSVTPASVATLPAGTSPQVTSAACPAITAATTPSPVINDSDMQFAGKVLQAVDPAHGLSEYARLSASFAWWMRGSGSTVNQSSIGTAIHELNHSIDFQLTNNCNSDRLARYFVDGKVFLTGLTFGTTANYSIISETYPAPLKIARSFRFDIYIKPAAAYSGNDFSMVLDELNAYSGVANFEINLLSNPAYAYLESAGDMNAGGMVDFMLYMQSYLKAARLSHPAAYAAIKGNGQTLNYMQFAWTRAETILTAMYPYSVAAGKLQRIPLDVMAAIYSSEFLAELDAIGITHKTAASWSSSYLR